MIKKGLPEDLLRNAFNLQFFNNKPVFIHRSHGWTMYLAYHAQQLGLLSKPCTLVMFDGHRDMSYLRHLKKRIIDCRNAGNPQPEMEFLSKEIVDSNNNTWIRIGMQLGVFGDAILFGGAHDRSRENGREIKLDNSSSISAEEIVFDNKLRHLVIYLDYLSSEISNQLRGEYHEEASHNLFWNLLGWNCDEYRFQFTQPTRDVLISIDLDYFTTIWKECIFPWPECVWEYEMSHGIGFYKSERLSSKDFFRNLVLNSQIIDIALEPRYCGGKTIEEYRDNCKLIFSKFNYYILSNKLNASKIDFNHEMRF